METNNYPALYVAADSASDLEQGRYLLCIRAQSCLLIFGSLLSVIGIKSAEAAIGAAVIYLAGLGFTVLLAFVSFETKWYNARAVAESIKTATWRFMMNAEPFNSGSLETSKAKLLSILRSILREHKTLASSLAEQSADGKQLTDKMLETRGLNLKSRIEVYRVNRVEDQRKWYSNKAAGNRRSSIRWFTGLVFLQGAAIASSIATVAWPASSLRPTQIFAVAASATLGWIQAKRFRELATAYALANHEIGVAEAELDDIKDDDSFSKFVGDCENAFSREHTQWIARKDE